MSIKLSSAQVLRIREEIDRTDHRHDGNQRRNVTEELVEFILKEVLPPCPLVENKNVQRNANVS